MRFRTALPIGHGGSNGGGIAVDTATGNVLITNSVDGTVTLINPADEVCTTLPVGDPCWRDRGPGPAPLPGRFEGRQQHHHHRRHGARLLACCCRVSAPHRATMPGR